MNIQLTGLDQEQLLTLLQELVSDINLADGLARVREHVPPGKKEVLPYQAAALYLAASQVPDGGRILEVGTNRGFTAAVMALAAPGAMVTTLESEPTKVEVARPALEKISNVHVVQCESTEYLDRITVPKVTRGYDLIFIDGDHANIAADLPWFNRLNVGGLIVFHDYSPAGSVHACPPVYEELVDLARHLGREPEVLIVDDERTGMAGWYRREGEICTLGPGPELIDGQLRPKEGAWLRRAARRIPSGQVIVELGSFTGKSTSCLACGSAEGVHVPVYAVDLWTWGANDGEGRFFRKDSEPDGPRHNSKFSRPRALARWHERMTEFDKLGLVVQSQGATLDVAKTFDQPIGLLFIDADHRYAAVKADFEAWSPMVVPDGIVAFHDYKECTRVCDGGTKRPWVPSDGKLRGEGVKAFVDEHLLGHGWRKVGAVGSLFAVQRIP